MKLLFVAASVLLAAAATAQPSSAPATEPGVEKPELDRIVCEKQEQIGTRLGARKVCKTVRQWQEQRRIQREEVEKVQQNIGRVGG